LCDHKTGQVVFIRPNCSRCHFKVIHRMFRNCLEIAMDAMVSIRFSINVQNNRTLEVAK